MVHVNTLEAGGLLSLVTTDCGPFGPGASSHVFYPVLSGQGIRVSLKHSCHANFTASSFVCLSLSHTRAHTHTHIFMRENKME